MDQDGHVLELFTAIPFYSKYQIISSFCLVGAKRMPLFIFIAETDTKDFFLFYENGFL